MNTIATILSMVIIGINVCFVIFKFPYDIHWAYLILVIVYGILYLLFCIYLTIHMAISMGATGLLRISVRIFCHILKTFFKL